MDFIRQSKMFKSSKRQSKILAAYADPVNKPLVKQIRSYVDGKEVDSLVEVKIDPEAESAAKREQMAKAQTNSESPQDAQNSPSASPAPSHGPAPSGGSHVAPASFTPSESFGDSDFDFSDDAGIPEDLEPAESTGSDESEPIDESTKIVGKSQITATNHVTVETVTRTVNELKGYLNLSEDTAGVIYAVLKGGSDNEVWVYYDSEVDINSVLEGVTKAFEVAGYCFLEFSRVSRKDNAIVFSINWVSNYYRQAESLGDLDEA